MPKTVTFPVVVTLWCVVGASIGDALAGPPERVEFVVAFYPLCRAVAGRPVIPTLNLIGTLDEWTPAADCSQKIDAWGTDGVPIEQVVYPSVHHSFYYPELQPGRTIFGRWAEYNEEAAADASHRMREFLNRHLN